MKDDSRNVIIRPMKEEDLELVMKWRMSPEVTKYMYTDPQLSLEQQILWYNSRKKAGDNYLFIIQEDDTPIGVYTVDEIDMINKRCTSGMYIGETDRRTIGLAVRLEYSFFDFLFYELNLNRTYAEIFCENKGMVRLNKMCGWELEGIMKEHIFKYGIYHDIALLACTKKHWTEFRKECKYKRIPVYVE